jgi:hypothetical protein
MRSLSRQARQRRGSIYYYPSAELWRAYVSVEGGKRKYLSGKTRQGAPKKLAAALQHKERGLPFVPERVAVGEWLDYWLDETIRPRHDAATGQQVARREPTTWASYELLVRRQTKS